MSTRRTRCRSGWKLAAGRSGRLLVATCALTCACATAERPPSGPPPEYIPPRVLPWDAGSSTGPQDPFAAAAASDRLASPESSNGAERAGSGGPNPTNAAGAEGAAPRESGDAGADPGGASSMRSTEIGDAAAAGARQ
jgi:hypothetical protein